MQLCVEAAALARLVLKAVACYSSDQETHRTSHCRDHGRRECEKGAKSGSACACVDILMSDVSLERPFLSGAHQTDDASFLTYCLVRALLVVSGDLA